MTTTIGRAVLLCRHLDASARFWADGFGFRTLFRGETDGFPLLHVGPGRVDDPGLWLVPLPDDAAPPARHGLPELVLYVDDVDAALARLAGLGVEPFEGPGTDAASGDRSAHVHDPDGHHVVLVRLGGTRP